MIKKENSSASYFSEKEGQPFAEKTKKTHYDPINNVIADRGRWALATLMALSVVVLLSLTLLNLAPLKSVVPYVVEVDTATRQVVGTAQLRYYAPAALDVAIAATNWAENVLSINRHLLKSNLRTAESLACNERARQQLARFIRQDEPHRRLVTDPNITRTVVFPTDPVAPQDSVNTMILRAETTTNEKINGKAKTLINGWVIVLNYAVRTAGEAVPFDTFRKNPTGICFSSISIEKELLSS